LLLSEAIPPFAQELQKLLSDAKESQLAEQVATLKIVLRCPCGDDFCATFYTRHEPKVYYAPDHRNIVLEPQEGMVVLDVIENQIVGVEVLFREDVRKALDAALPLRQ